MGYDDDVFDNTISGRTGSTSIRILFGQELSDEVASGYLNEIKNEFQKILRKAEDVGSIPGEA